MLRISALAVLVVGIAGVTFQEMPSMEAGRLYMIALGLYLIAPAERVEKGKRGFGLLRQKKRYLLGALSLFVALGLIAFQFTLELI